MDDEVDFQIDMQGRVVARFPNGVNVDNGWVPIGRIIDDGEPVGTFGGRYATPNVDGNSYTIEFVASPSVFITAPAPKPPPPPDPTHPRTAYLDIDATPVILPIRRRWFRRHLDL